MKPSYNLSDVGVIIPTYNRPDDLKKTLKSVIPFVKSLNEVIIVDQSKEDKTRNLIKKLGIRKIKYVYSKIPSIAISRNIGVKNLSSKSKIVIFIDDDVDIGANYFEKILEVFNENNSALAVGAYKRGFKWGWLENFFRKIFSLEYYESDRARIMSAYGNTYPNHLDRIINSQWLPGVNMAYRKEVFSRQKFDENLLGYTIAEDTDFGYRLYRQHPNSLFITPYPKIIHRASVIERYPTKKMSYINQVDHFYFNYKNLNKNIFQKLLFGWSLFGIAVLRTFVFLFSPKKANWLKLTFFFESLIYSIKNTSRIKKGKLREFNL